MLNPFHYYSLNKLHYLDLPLAVKPLEE